MSDLALAVARVEWAEGERRLAQLDLPRPQLETVLRVVADLLIAQDLSLVQQAAFARFARGAVDYRP
jgi:hypothetical protein